MEFPPSLVDLIIKNDCISKLPQNLVTLSLRNTTNINFDLPHNLKHIIFSDFYNEYVNLPNNLKYVNQ